jgi:membrane associated rhomboid family serine protease
MRQPGQFAAAFPRPGRALKAVLIALGAAALILAIVMNWAPGGAAGQALVVQWLAFKPGSLANVYLQPWTLLTSGLVTLGLSHVMWSLVGLYFLTPTLESQWGGARLVRFLVTAVVLGNLVVALVSLVPLKHHIFHPEIAAGPSAAIAAVAIAWSRQNAHRQFMFMFFLPMTGRMLFFITVGFAVLYVLFGEAPPEGAFALFGGILTGVLFAGSPSPARAAYLRLKLFFLRRRGGGNLTVESITGIGDRPRPKRKVGGPDLRVVQGGAEDEKKRDPKDKRYLN